MVSSSRSVARQKRGELPPARPSSESRLVSMPGSCRRASWRVNHEEAGSFAAAVLKLFAIGWSRYSKSTRIESTPQLWDDSTHKSNAGRATARRTEKIDVPSLGAFPGNIFDRLFLRRGNRVFDAEQAKVEPESCTIQCTLVQTFHIGNPTLPVRNHRPDWP